MNLNNNSNLGPESDTPASQKPSRICSEVIDHQKHGMNEKVLTPCSFDLWNNFRETIQIDDEPEMMQELWHLLNISLIYLYAPGSPENNR